MKMPTNHTTASANMVLLLKELHNAVQSLPIEDHITSIELSYGSNPDPIHVMKERAEKIIEHLKFQASFGSDDAIRALRDLGNNAAESLLSLFPNKNGKESGLPPLYGMPLTTSLAPVTLAVDMEPLNQIVSCRLSIITASSRAEIRKAFSAIPTSARVRIKASVTRLSAGPSPDVGCEVSSGRQPPTLLENVENHGCPVNRKNHL